MNRPNACSTLLRLTTLALLAACGCAAPAEDNDAPFSAPPTYEQFRASLPRDPGDNGLYLIDGDIRGTEAHVRAFYDAYVASMRAPDLDDVTAASGQGDFGRAASALTVNQRPTSPTCRWVRFAPPPVPPVWVCTPPGLTDDVWSPSERTNLTFCLEGFGGDRATVARAMQAASRAWEAVAGVRFVYLPGEDASCNPLNNNVRFEVMLDPASPIDPTSGEALYGANAAYPSVPRQGRQVRVHSATVNSGGLANTLTHELGHMLGFQHEHVRVSQAGASWPCRWDAPTAWRGVTSYDPNSIMHYSGCNGSTPASGAGITTTDAAGAAALYGAPASTPRTCAHIPLTSGAPLDALCAPAVAQVCSVDAFCCTTSWDGLCIDELARFL